MSAVNVGILLIFAFITCVLSYSGEFIPKSYYVIDHNGHKSDVVYFRSKRDVELFPLLRMKRGGGSGGSGGSGASSQSSASSNSNAGSGGGGAPLYSGGSGYNAGIIDPAEFIPNFGPDFFNFPIPSGGGSGSFAHSFASSSSSNSAGNGQGFGGVGGGPGGHNIPTLYSRFGEDTGTGVKISSSAQGPRGAFSSSSSSIDSDGKITYSTKSGKY